MWIYVWHLGLKIIYRFSLFHIFISLCIAALLFINDYWDLCILFHSERLCTEIESVCACDERDYSACKRQVACTLTGSDADFKEVTDFDRSIKCWQLLDARYLKWSDCQPKLDASKAAGHVAPVLYYQLSGSAWQKLAVVIPAAVTPAVAVDFPLTWDLWFAIQYADLFWPLVCANLKILTS